MTDTQEDPKPDQPVDPEVPPAEGEPTDQTPAPAPTDSTEAPEAEGQRWSQASFTKVTQELARVRGEQQTTIAALQDEIAALRAERGAGRPAEAETPDDPRVDTALKGSRIVKELTAEVARLRQSNTQVETIAVTNALATKYPDLAGEMDQFLGWVGVPGRAQAFQAAGLKPAAILAAYRSEHPAKRGAAPKGPAKVPARVETSSAPRGTIRDIRDKLREQGKTGKVSSEEAFDVAVNEARRELAAQ